MVEDFVVFSAEIQNILRVNSVVVRCTTRLSKVLVLLVGIIRLYSTFPQSLRAIVNHSFTLEVYTELQYNGTTKCRIDPLGLQFYLHFYISCATFVSLQYPSPSRFSAFNAGGFNSCPVPLFITLYLYRTTNIHRTQ